MKKTLLFLCFLLSVTIMYAQEKTVSGVVKSFEDGGTLPGVSVVVKGTAVGTTTDADGKFSIEVSSNDDILVFTFIGMTTEEVAVGTKSSFDVELMPSIEALSEVVVTALGVSREKKALGYSVQDVKGDELIKAREANVINSLHGRISGAAITSSSGAVGASSRIVLRGTSSLTKDNQPLFVVDGVPIDNSNFGSNNADFGSTGNEGTNRGSGVADINPDDVESISVLKGPNAAALYGSRAANGAIIITTKKGKLNKGEKTLGISVSNSTSFENPLRLPDFQDTYGQGSQGRFSFVDGAGNGTNDGTDESWGPKLDDGSKVAQFNSPVGADGTRTPTPWVSHPDNVKNFFETGTNIATNVSIYGGSEVSTFRLSFTNSDEKGIVPNTDFHKKNLSFAATSNPFEKLTVSTSGNYVNANSSNMPGYGYSGNNVMQQFIWFGRQVDISELENYTDANGDKYNWNYNYHNNPYFTLHENLNTLKRDRFYGNASAKYDILEWLSAVVKTGGDMYTNLNTDRRAIGDMDFPNGYYGERINTFREINTDFLITAAKDLTEDIHGELSFGGNRMDREIQINSGTAPELTVPNVYNVQNSAVAMQATNFSSRKRVNSFYGTGQVSYKNALFLDVSGRNDWSSALPEANNSYFYPAANLSVLPMELLGKKSDILSYAKVRGGWAQVGGDTDPYQLFPTLSFGDGWNADSKLVNQFVPNSLPNADLKPEKIRSWEIGTELSFFVSRVRLDFTYYNSKAFDQIINIPISPATGYTSRVTNAGQIDNKGIEIILGLTPVKAKNADGLNWSINFNFAKNNNEVVELPDGIEAYELGGYWSMDVMAIPGEKYGVLYGYDFKRDPDGNIIYANGLPQQGDIKILGNSMPDWIGGVSNEFTFKGLELSALIDIRQGGQMYSMTNTWGRYAGVLEETLIGREGGIVGDGVKEEVDANGNITYVTNDVVVSAEDFNKSAYTNDVAYSSVFDASYIKLREVKLGYTLKKIGNLPFVDVNISVVGRNLAILKSSVPHIDPETAFNNSNVQGLEFGQLPSVRSIGFRISFKM